MVFLKTFKYLTKKYRILPYIYYNICICHPFRGVLFKTF